MIQLTERGFEFPISIDPEDVLPNSRVRNAELLWDSTRSKCWYDFDCEFDVDGESVKFEGQIQMSLVLAGDSSLWLKVKGGPKSAQALYDWSVRPGTGVWVFNRNPRDRR